MGENFIEKFEKSAKTLETRAGYTRRFLKKQEISDEDFIAKAKGVGVTVSDEEMKDDKTLVKKVCEIQSIIGLEKTDSKEGTDGMFGPITLGKLNAFITGKTGRKDVSGVVSSDVSGEGKGVEPEKIDKEPTVKDVASGKADSVGVPIWETPQANLDKILKEFTGKKEVVKLLGNGGRQVMIYIPEGFDPSKPVEIDYHFHGTCGNWIDVNLPVLSGTDKDYNDDVGRPGKGSKRLGQALGAAQKHKNMILVYPLSAGQRGSVSSTGYKHGYDNDWMKKGNSTTDDMAVLHTETMAKVNGMLGAEVKNPSITISGHSAGGIAVRNALVSGFSPDKAKFLDATYGSWASSAYSGVKDKDKTKFEIYVKTGTETDNRDVHSIKDSKNVTYVPRSDLQHGDFIPTYL